MILVEIVPTWLRAQSVQDILTISYLQSHPLVTSMFQDDFQFSGGLLLHTALHIIQFGKAKKTDILRTTKRNTYVR